MKTKLIIINDNGINSVFTPWILNFLKTREFDEIWMDFTITGNQRILKKLPSHANIFGVVPYTDKRMLSLAINTNVDYLFELIDERNPIVTRRLFNRFEKPFYFKLYNRTLAVKELMKQIDENSIIVVGWCRAFLGIGINAIYRLTQKDIDFLLVTKHSNIGDLSWVSSP